jgi:ABC-type cobalamin/Fe3+-siderophores transport system ATPase subunit
MILELHQVSYRYPGAEQDAVKGVGLAVAPGELVGVVGPNGSGKTTLVRLLLGVLTPTTGLAKVKGVPIPQWRRRELARMVGVVLQREEPAFPLRVEDTVALGRYPYVGALGSLSSSDRDVIDQALARCDVARLRRRWADTLSGGEWQRVRIARALAQEPDALVFDEATANLDIRHEMEVLELLVDLVHNESLAGILVTHHVNLAARFVDRLLVLDGGEARASGPPLDVLTQSVLERVFQWPVDVEIRDGIPQFMPLRKRNTSP